MISVRVENDFESWRAVARRCLAARIAPGDIHWGGSSGGLFSDQMMPSAATTADDLLRVIFSVPKDFIDLSAGAICYDDPGKFSLLYRILYRLTFENRNLLRIETDDDVHRAFKMKKAVDRDIHKFHAFVRFRKIEPSPDDRETFIAFHKPRHYTVEPALPFFVRRFGAMSFSILTPKGSAHWNKKDLIFGEPVDADLFASTDELSDFWLTYYKSIFNPHRLKVPAMKKEMPVAYWSTLPEARLIPGLIRSAEKDRKHCGGGVDP